tara:strand:- start:2702 stop:3397 length:696 start_codon:yes stop_codon:yes gene_type:complete
MTESSYRVCAVFTLKDQESKNRFIEFANGDNGLSVTRAAKGCKSLNMFESREDAMKLIIWQEWDCKENQQAYIKHRHEDGTFEMIGEIVACPPNITPIKEMVMKTEEEKVRDVINDMCQVDYKLGMKHMHDDCVFIRPTGNPLNKKGWEDMMSNDDVKVESSKLVSINKLSVCGCCAYVCYTQHGKFTYKGTSNDDVAVFTCVLRKYDGVWKVVQGSRSTGRKPSDPQPTF